MAVVTADEYLRRHLLRNVREFTEHAPCLCDTLKSKGGSGIPGGICWRCLLKLRVEEYDILKNTGQLGEVIPQNITSTAEGQQIEL